MERGDTFLSGTWTLFSKLMHSRLSPEEELMEHSLVGDSWWTLGIAIKAEESRWVLPGASRQQQPGIATRAQASNWTCLRIPAGTDWLCNLELFP